MNQPQFCKGKKAFGAWLVGHVWCVNLLTFRARGACARKAGNKGLFCPGEGWTVGGEGWWGVGAGMRRYGGIGGSHFDSPYVPTSPSYKKRHYLVQSPHLAFGGNQCTGWGEPWASSGASASPWAWVRRGSGGRAAPEHKAPGGPRQPTCWAAFLTTKVVVRFVPPWLAG